MARLAKRYYDTIMELREKCPLRFPVRVLRVDPAKFKSEPGKIADADFKESKECFVLRISNKLPTDVAIDVVVHEWAHLLLWDYPLAEKAEGDHHAEWGVAHARCYRAIFED